MAVALKISEQGTHIPESGSWMYDRHDVGHLKPRMQLLDGLRKQHTLCDKFLERIGQGLPCNIPLSLQNLSNSLVLFGNDIALCRLWILHREHQVKPPFYQKYAVLMGRTSSNKTEQDRHIEYLLIEDANNQLKQIQRQYFQIQFSCSNKKVEALDNKVKDLQNRKPQNSLMIQLMFAVAFVALGIMIGTKIVSRT